MGKKKEVKRAENAKRDRISKTTIILYAAVIIISVAFLAVMSAGQQSSGSSCGCGGFDCTTMCCCNCYQEGCKDCCSMHGSEYSGISAPSPWTGESMNAREWYCSGMGSPPLPPEGECDPGRTQDCLLQEGVCEGAKEKCKASGQWPNVGSWEGCSISTYKENNPSYESDERACDDIDNDCDGETDEGCDEDDDGFCSEDMRCSSEDYNCGTAAAGSQAESDECTDCDDSNPLINPLGTEVCDAAGVDENCNHIANEGCECSPIGAQQACEKTLGVCAGAANVCINCADSGSSCVNPAVHASEWKGCQYGAIEGYRSTESGTWYCADNLDNDCDGYTDCDVRESGCLPFCPPQPVP